MVEKGVGEYQIRKAQTSEKQILQVLSDGKWHRYQEIKEAVKLSTATISKVLKRLERGLIEKKLDLETREYPHPVYYRLKPDVPTENIRMWREFLAEVIKRKSVKEPERYIELLNQLVGLQVLENLKYHFLVNESEEAFEQALEFLVLDVYREAVHTLKEKLRELGKTEDLQVLLAEAETRMANDYEHMLKEKRKDKKS
ncbi:hypothetical protein KEJ37_06905 [Candidatus Bathyarchaeota archaeon]|nr:hypothetical protein [Candidatus Bathyarchaeota archaeon]